jgi:hypothetical protein
MDILLKVVVLTQLLFLLFPAKAGQVDTSFDMLRMKQKVKQEHITPMFLQKP